MTVKKCGREWASLDQKGQCNNFQNFLATLVNIRLVTVNYRKILLLQQKPHNFLIIFAIKGPIIAKWELIEMYSFFHNMSIDNLTFDRHVINNFICDTNRSNDFNPCDICPRFRSGSYLKLVLR